MEVINFLLYASNEVADGLIFCIVGNVHDILKECVYVYQIWCLSLSLYIVRSVHSDTQIDEVRPTNTTA